jgi:uncharacterized membrane protein YhiD involved in acid resistance
LTEEGSRRRFLDVDVEVGVGLGAIALVVGWPALLLMVMWLLGRLEAWVLQPDERAAAVEQLLAEAKHADEVERAVTQLLSEVADPPYARRSRSA